MINYQLESKVAMVTGGASGIGLACAELLAFSGADIAIWDLHDDALEAAKQRIQKHGVKCITQKVDVSDQQSVIKAMTDTIKQLGHLDIAVNNAGIGGPFEKSGDYKAEDWLNVININFNGVFYCQQEAIKAMRTNGSGSIINMASILGQVAFEGAPAYVSAKHGVVGMTKAAAIEHAVDGIRINSVGPGFIHTPLVDQVMDDATLNAIAQKHAMKRLGTPEEVAHLVAWLASDASSFVTASYYPVDGGYLAY